jgi:putative aldouronate transport system permease protein
MKRTRQTPEDTLFDGVVFAISLLIFVIMAYPMYFILIASFSDSLAVSAGKVWLWPANATLYGYVQVFANARIWIGYRNTIVYVVVATILNLLVTMPAAYAISRRDLRGRKLITLFFVFTVYFSGGLVPTYLTARTYGLVNTFWVLVIPFGVSWSNLIVSRAYFASNIPDELLEAARMDGCGNTRFFVSVVLPLSKAIVAVITLYTVVGQWDSWFQYLVYVRKESLVPLQIVLREILLVNYMSVDPLRDLSEQMRYREILKYSLIIVTTLPVMCFYPFIQKYFTKGVMIGAIKG